MKGLDIMKKTFILILCLASVFLFAACGNDNGNSDNNGSGNLQQTTGDDGKEIIESDNVNISTEDSNLIINDKKEQPVAQKVYVVRSFFAVEGAVIYDQTYDEYGYPDCCYFHKKCESCGDVSNNNGSARSNIITSYYCPKCKTTNHVEIKADSDWVEVYE